MRIFSGAFIMVWLAAAAGWIMNIGKLFTVFVSNDTLQVTGILVGRIIGVFFAPLGCVLGYF